MSFLCFTFALSLRGTFLRHCLRLMSNNRFNLLTYISISLYLRSNLFTSPLESSNPLSYEWRQGWPISPIWSPKLVVNLAIAMFLERCENEGQISHLHPDVYRTWKVGENRSSTFWATGLLNFLPTLELGPCSIYMQIDFLVIFWQFSSQFAPRPAFWRAKPKPSYAPANMVTT